MSKILALDYGDKRIGVASSDPSGTLASLVGTFINKGTKKSAEQVKDLCQEHSAAKIVIGVPFGLNQEETEQTQKTRAFIKILKETVDAEIIEVDERFSSVIAAQQIIDGGTKVKSGDIDSVSARLILQDYLDSKK